MISQDLLTAPDGKIMPHRPVPAWLGYATMLLGVMFGIALLSLLIGERRGIGRIVWLLVGLLLGSVWSFRQRLPLLNSSTTLVAVGGWSGLILAGILTLTFAPTALPSAATLASETARNSNSALRPAPPTAVHRTGTVGPTPRPAPARPSPSPKPASPTLQETADATDGLQAAPVPDGTAAPSPSPAPRRSPTVARATPSPTPVLSPGFDPQRYLGQGNAFSCDDFASQAEAQAVLRADPMDPNVIDMNRDGVACEANPPPRDTRRVPRPAP